MKKLFTFLCATVLAVGSLSAKSANVNVASDEGRYIVVNATAKVANPWDNQLWFVLGDFAEGDSYEFSADIKATKAAAPGTQLHGEPGSYIHYAAIGNPNFSTEWTTVTASGKFEKAGASIAFNLNDFADANDYYLDNVSFKVNGVERIVNGSFDTDDMSSFVQKIADGAIVPCTITEVVPPAPRYVVVPASAMKENPWDNQAWFILGDFAQGDSYEFSCDVKADKAASVGTQIHTAPGNYVHWAAIGNLSFTTEWATIKSSGKFDAAGSSIALNLNDFADANTYYFDNLSLKVNGKERIINGSFDGFSTESIVMKYNEGDKAGQIVDTKITMEKAPEAPKTLADGQYYFINYENDLFLEGNNSWGTQASTGSAASLFDVTKLENGNYDIANNLLSCAKKKLGQNLYIDSDTPATGWQISSDNSIYSTIYLEGNGYVAASKTLGSNNLPIVEFVADVTDAAKWIIISKEAFQEAMKANDAAVNMTAYISNPDFSRNLDQSAWVVGEETTNKNLGGGANENFCAESWRSAFTISQTIEGLPNGTYQVDVQASCVEYEKTGLDLPVVFANDATSTFVISSQESTMENGENSMSMMSASFTQGLYRVQPIIVEVKDGKLTIGVKGTRTDTWCIWDNFRLTKLADAAEPTPIQPAAIDVTKIAPATWEGEGGKVADWAWNGHEGASEVYNGGGSIAAGDVLTQTLAGIPNGTYTVTMELAASFTSDRGFECPTGDDLAVAFVNDKSQAISVVDRTSVAADGADQVSITVNVTDGNLKYGVKNLAPAGNWYLAKLVSIMFVPAAAPAGPNLPKGYAAVTDLNKLDGKTVLLMNVDTEEFLYGKDAQNTAVADFETATDASNVVTAFVAEKADNGFLFKNVTPAGADYALWGKNPCYLNSQPNVGGVSFNLGKDQDCENGSTWNLIWNAEKNAFAIQSVANGGYLAGTTIQAEPTYWVIATAASVSSSTMGAIITDIDAVETTKTVNGKMIENGSIVIVKNGVKYNVNGSRIK